MGCNHQTRRLGSAKLDEVIEVGDALRRRIEIEQQHVLVLDRPFHAGNQGNAADSRVFSEVPHVKPAIVQRNREYVVTKCSRPVDQISRRVRDVVVRVG
jgi:hypothetical protein